MAQMILGIALAVRRLCRAPAFSAATVATLGLGIGATSATFALIHAVLLEPLPYVDADRLVAVRHAAPGWGVADGGQSEGTYLHYRMNNRSFDDFGVYVENVVTITDGETPERIPVALASASLFSVLDVRPAIGRTFTPSDDEPGAPPIVVISNGLWVRRYGADPGVLGRTIELNRLTFQIAGVMPPGFDFPRPETQVWYNMSPNAANARVRTLDLAGVAKLKRGVTPKQAAIDLQRLVPSLEDAYPEARDVLRDAQLRALVIPLKTAIVADARPGLVILFCTASVVLLVAWANLATLFLVRAERQRKDVAVERALGAAGVDLARRILSEPLVLAVLGSALGLACAYAGVVSRFGFDAGQIPRLDRIQVNGPVIAFTATLLMVSGVVLGVASLRKAGNVELMAALKGTLGRMTADHRWHTAQHLLVGGQIALALPLLIGSAVMVRSMWRLNHVDLGFDPRGTLTFEVSLPFRPYPTYQAAARFHDRMLERLRAIPGVAAAEAVMGLPLTPLPSVVHQPVTVTDGGDDADRSSPVAVVNLVTPGFFSAMHIPLIAGRWFEAGDVGSHAVPTIISAALARALFGQQEAIGRAIRFVKYSKYPSYVVVGVVGNIQGEGIAVEPSRVLYFPVLAGVTGDPQGRVPIPFFPFDMSVIVRTSLPPTSIASSARGVVHDLDSKVPLSRFRGMDAVVDASTARTRLTTVLVLLAGGAALFLAVIGAYGVVSYGVSQRTSEFGIRLALGASPEAVTRMVLLESSRVGLIGVGVGLLLAFALTRFLSGVVFGVSPVDPVSFAMMSLLLLSTTVAASYLPAYRAGRLDPTTAIRSE